MIVFLNSATKKQKIKIGISNKIKSVKYIQANKRCSRSVN